MSISVADLASRYAAASKQVSPQASKELKAMSQVAVGLTKRAIQDFHAVDTSTMLNSAQAEAVGKDTYLIGPTVGYASFVALGTSRVAARPFHVAAASALNKQAHLFGFDPKDVGI